RLAVRAIAARGKVIGERRPLGDLDEMHVKPARLTDMNRREPFEKFKVVLRWREHRYAEMEAQENALGITVANDAIGGRTIDPSQMADIHAFCPQRFGDDVTGRIPADGADISRCSSEAAHEDRQIEAIATREHFASRQVAI